MFLSHWSQRTIVFFPRWAGFLEGGDLKFCCGVLVMPLPMYQGPAAKPGPVIKNILAVAAGKGGVGKSTVTVNLAVALMRQGYTVGIMDTDIYGPSIRKMLPEDRMPAQNGDTIIPALCRGIKMISMAYFRKDGQAQVVRAPIANGIVAQFIRNVQWGDLDFLLVDFPPGTGDIQLTLAQQANLSGAVMVTTPQEISLMDVRRAMDMFHQVHIPIIGIVENMSGMYLVDTKEKIYPFGRGGGERLARETGLPFLGEIPLDPLLCSNSDKGEMSHWDGSPSQEAFESVSAQVLCHLDALKAGVGEHLASFELVWKEAGR